MRKVEQIVLVGKVKVNLEKRIFSQNYFQNDSQVLSRMQRIEIIRIDKVGESDYNKDTQEERFLRLLKFIGTKNQEERDKFTKGDRMLMKMNEFTKEFSKTRPVPPGYDYSEFRYAQGYEAGEDSVIIKTVQKMLEKKYSFTEITEITGLEENEIKQIEQTGTFLKF